MIEPACHSRSDGTKIPNIDITAGHLPNWLQHLVDINITDRNSGNGESTHPYNSKHYMQTDKQANAFLYILLIQIGIPVSFS